MDIERLITLIVKTVVEELGRQGLIRVDHVSNPERQAVAEPAVSSPATSRRRVISAEVVLDVVRTGGTMLEISSDALVTPLAQDTAKEKGVAIKRV